MPTSLIQKFIPLPISLSYLALRADGRKDTVKVEGLDAPLVADVDQTIVIGVIGHHHVRLRSCTVFFDWRSHTAENTNVTCKRHFMYVKGQESLY